MVLHRAIAFAHRQMLRFFIPSLILLVGAGVAPVAWGQTPIDADILLVGGELYLGDGAPPTTGDVAIKGDKIVAVGQFERGEIDHVIDCAGLIVSPGFIDLHNHSDRTILNSRTRSATNYLTQGCTTIVTGNCGSGPIDTRAYYERLDELGAGVNVAHLLPQGSLRGEVMGNERRKATEEELSKMRELADAAMAGGAWGMSSGLIYVPSSYADTEELIEIAKVVARHGGIYASHIRGEGTGLLDSIDEALRIGRDAEVAVHVSHFKSSGKDAWGLVRTAAQMIESAREAGQRVTADQYPYTASSTSLSATCIPTWARAGTDSQVIERLTSDGDEGRRARAAIQDKLELTDNGHRIQIASFRPRPDWAGKRLDEIAAAEGTDTLALVLDIERQGGASIVNHGINEQDVRFVMTLPWVATASDGSSRIPSGDVPHPRSYGTFTRKLGHYAVREGALPLAQAIRSCTGLPADVLGMSDRGYLRAGAMADVVVWNKDRMIDTATFTEPHGYSEGVAYVFVNGVPAIAHGVTGALAGRALRHDG